MKDFEKRITELCKTTNVEKILTITGIVPSHAARLPIPLGETGLLLTAVPEAVVNCL